SVPVFFSVETSFGCYAQKPRRPLSAPRFVGATDRGAMAPTVAVKLLEAVKKGTEPAGYWGMSSSIYAKELLHVEADKESTVKSVKARVAEKGAAGPLRLILFGKELEDERTLGSYGLGNIEDPLLHAIPA
ncbi:Hypothetical protein SCF082_LOCUS41178, partial [Durusdinium trenchii]